MNVIICDDDNSFVHELKNLIEPLFEAEYPGANVYCFNNGFELFDWYINEGSTIDILYIDVEMPGYNGLEIIKKLQHAGCTCLTVFISSYQSYAIDTFDYNVNQYLLKPIKSEKIISVTKKLLYLYKKKYNKIELLQKDQHIYLSIDQIISFETNSRKLICHTVEGDFNTTAKISQLEKELLPFGFLRTHKSYLINMDKVVYYRHYTFYMQMGIIAEISRTRKPAIIAKYNNFIFKKIIH